MRKQLPEGQVIAKSESTPAKGFRGEDVSLLLVEDDSIVRSWVQATLEGTEFRLAGEAATAADAVALAERRRADLVLVDQRLPDGPGTQLVRDLRARGLKSPILLMTANRERGFNEAAREAGAQGTVWKSGSVKDLLAALRAVVRGETTYDSSHPRRPPGHAALAPREREVLLLLASGATNREIASQLALGEETVKTLVARTFAKLGVRRRAEAVAAAHARGLL